MTSCTLFCRLHPRVLKVFVIFLAMMPLLGHSSERALERQIRQAMDEVAIKKQSVNDAERALASVRMGLPPGQQVYRSAKNQLDQTERAIVALEQPLRDLDAQELLLTTQIDAVQTEAQLDQLEAQFRKLKNDQQRIRESSAFKQKRAELEAMRKRHDDVFWNARRQWVGLTGQYALAEAALVSREDMLFRASQLLADLRLLAMSEHSRAMPAHLASVTATQRGSVVYQGDWIETADVDDEKIDIMRKLIADQNEQVHSRKMGFDQAYQELERAGDQMDALSAEYEMAIWAQAYKTILIQTAGAATNIVLGRDGGGLVAVYTELASRLADAATSDVGASYDLPILANGTMAGGISDDMNSFTGLLQHPSVINRWKEMALAAVEGFVGGKVSVKDLGGLKMEVWITPKLEGMAGSRLGDMAASARTQLLAVRNGTEAAALFKKTALRTLKDINYRSLLSNMAKSASVDAIEKALADAARSTRIDSFKRWLDFDVEIAAHRKALWVQRILWQQDRAQLKSLHLALKELIDEQLKQKQTRILRVSTDHRYDTEHSGLIKLNFSRQVDNVKLSIAGHSLQLSGANYAFTARVPAKLLDDGQSHGQVVVSASDVFLGNSLDSAPGLIGLLDDNSQSTQGEDRYHSLSLAAQETISMEGIWVGRGYHCGESNLVQIVQITQQGDEVMAIKVTGDDCIREGQVTWRGNFQSGAFGVEFHVSNGPGGAQRWKSRQLEIVDANTLRINKVTYTRVED